MTAEPAPYDHYRPTDANDVPDGVYRVVGTGDGTVTLLAVCDGTGRRIHAGRLASVPPGTLATEFEPAPNPDAGIRPGQVLDWLAWVPRALLDEFAGLRRALRERLR